jgi:hypothetical protein
VKIKVAIWYLAAIVISIFVQATCQSGPCTPNFDVLIPALFALLSFFFFFRALHYTDWNNQDSVKLTGIHLVGCVFLIYFAFGK